MATQAAKTPDTTTKPRTRAAGSANRKRPSPTVPASPQANADLVKSWLARPRQELDDLYRQAEAGPLPQGDTRGTPIFTGWPLASWLSALAHTLGWQGKVFDLLGSSRDAGVVVNKVTPLGLKLIVARVYRGESWLDGRETIVIDYSGTSMVARPIRDEIRQISPGLYLGKVWLGRRRILDFALEVPDPTAT